MLVNASTADDCLVATLNFRPNPSNFADASKQHKATGSALSQTVRPGVVSRQSLLLLSPWVAHD